MTRIPVAEDSDIIQRVMAIEAAWRAAAGRKCYELPSDQQCTETNYPVCRPLTFKAAFPDPRAALSAISTDLGATMIPIGVRHETLHERLVELGIRIGDAQ